MIQTYYGNGKGKTTAAIGVAIRASGSGKKVLFVQFFKNGDSCECTILKSLEGIELLIPDDNYVLFEKMDGDKIFQRRKAYQKVLETIKSKTMEYDMIVLDEVLDALQFQYLQEAEFLSFLEQHKQKCEIILTGHFMTEKLSELSDYLSEIQERKHPFHFGCAARKGIEF